MKELMSIDSRQFDHYARYSYENFLLNQPHIKTDGLFFVDSRYYIVCPELQADTKALDGSIVIDWFKSKRIASCPIELVREVPGNAVKIKERTIEQVVFGSGKPRNQRSALVSIVISLPQDFPKKVTLERSDEPFTIRVLVERELTEEECSLLEAALLKLELPALYKVAVDSSIGSKKESFRYKNGQGDIDIIPAKLLPYPVSHDLKKLLENDDDFWATNRIPIFTGKINHQNDVIPEAWDRFESRCLINASVFPQYNIHFPLLVGYIKF